MRGCEGRGATGEQVRQWRAVTAQANKEIVRLQRELAGVRERAEVERAILNEEVRGELVDREANGVRTADRYRAIYERQVNTLDQSEASGVYERAMRAAANIEAAIAGLCTHSLRNAGTALLVERRGEAEGSVEWQTGVPYV